MNVSDFHRRLKNNTAVMSAVTRLAYSRLAVFCARSPQGKNPKKEIEQKIHSSVDQSLKVSSYGRKRQPGSAGGGFCVEKAHQFGNITSLLLGNLRVVVAAAVEGFGLTGDCGLCWSSGRRDSVILDSLKKKHLPVVFAFNDGKGVLENGSLKWSLFSQSLI